MEREQQLQKIHKGLENTRKTLETLGTPEGSKAWSLDNFSGVRLVVALRHIGLGKKGLTEKTIPNLEGRREVLVAQIEEECKRNKILGDIKRMEKGLPELQELASQGYVTSKQLSMVTGELDFLRLSIGLTKKPEEEKRPEDAAGKSNAGDKTDQARVTERRQPKEKVVYKVALPDGQIFETTQAKVSQYVEIFVAHYHPDVEEAKKKAQTHEQLGMAVYASYDEKEDRDKVDMGKIATGKVLNGYGYAIAPKHDRNELRKQPKHSDSSIRQAYFMVKIGEPEKAEHIEEAEFRMNKEEAAMFGALVKVHNNVQLFGPSQDIDTGKPLLTLKFDEETLKLCDELIGQYDFEFNGEIAKQKERIKILRASMVNKLGLICQGGALGKAVVDQQSKQVQELYVNLFLIYGEILGDDLCRFLIESPMEKRVIKKASEKDKSAYVLDGFVKYWIVPSASFPARIQKYVESLRLARGDFLPAIEDPEVVGFADTDGEPVIELGANGHGKAPHIEDMESEKGRKRRKTEIEKLEETYPSLREKINLLLDRWQENISQVSGKRVGSNAIVNLFKGLGVPSMKKSDVELYMGKKYAKSRNSNDHHAGFSQSETILLLCWRYCKKGRNWNVNVAASVEKMIEEEITRRGETKTEKVG